MNKTLIGWIVVCIAAWRWAASRRARRAREQVAAAGAKPVEVATWEGEGGALPPGPPASRADGS